MIPADRWFGRQFEWRPQVGTFPMIVERLRGTPIRIEEKVSLPGHSGPVVWNLSRDSMSSKKHKSRLRRFILV